MENGAEVFFGLGILGLILGLIGFIVYIWSIFWAYKDAERRRRSGILIALLVAFVAWPLGLIIWLLIRPSVFERNY